MSTSSQLSLTVFSLVGALSSLSIVITGLIFPALLGHRLYHLIFFLNVSQFFVSLAGCLGAPNYQTESTTCHIKSGLWMIFFPSACFWGVACALSLRDCIVSTRLRGYLDDISRLKKGIANAPPSQSFLSHYALHALIWIPSCGFFALSWILNLNPLEVSCIGNDNTGFVVIFCVIYGLLALCLISILLCFFSLYSFVKSGGRHQQPLRTEVKTLRVFQAYPLSLLFVWTTEIVAYTAIVCIGIAFDGDDYIQWLEVILSCLPTSLPGVLNAFAFFWYSSEARQRWSRLCSKCSSRNFQYQEIPDSFRFGGSGGGSIFADVDVDSWGADEDQNDDDGTLPYNRSLDSVESAFADSVRSRTRSDSTGFGRI